MTSPSSKSMFQLKLVPLVFFQSTFQPSDASLQVTTVRIQRPNPPFLGVMNVYTAEGTQSFFVSSGSYTVNSDSTVSIIAEEACRLADLDKEAATKALATAQVKLVENTV